MLFISSSIIAQHNTEPEYYLNSEKIDVKTTFINPQSLDSLNVGHKTENGEIHLFTKKTDFTFLTIAEIVKIHNPDMEFDDSIIFKTNGKKIKTLFTTTGMSNSFNS